MELLELSLKNLIKCSEALKESSEHVDSLTETIGKIYTLTNDLTTVLCTKKCESKPTKVGRYNCKKCGETREEYFNRKISECIQCMSKVSYAKMIPVIEKGKERNIAARLERGKCHTCESIVTTKNVLSFDWNHRDPTKKSHGISKLNRKSDDVFYAEIAKCDLVCKNCHIYITLDQYKEGLIRKNPTMKEREKL
jgi:hypothetical protein